MVMKITLQLNNSPAELTTLVQAVESLTEKWGLTERQKFEINLILEELVVNVLNHGGLSEGHQVAIEITRKGDLLTMVLSDDGPPFNPTSAPSVNTRQPLSKRTAGGLGIYLVQQYTESMDYRRERGKNILTLRKTI